MVNINIPKELSEEEKSLQKKFILLRSKKKLLASLKTPKPEPKELSESKKRAQEDAAGNTEQAKRLLKSGAIKVAEKKDAVPQTFKRSKRQKESEKTSVSFQPFSPTSAEPENSPNLKPSQNYKKLYDNFISAGTTADSADSPVNSTFSPERKRPRLSQVQRPGNTLYVEANDLKTDVISNEFGKIGQMMNVKPDRKKSGCFFVTYEDAESATKAKNQLDGTTVSGVLLHAEFARRQYRPSFDTEGDELAAETWAGVAGRSGKKTTAGTTSETREAVVYDIEEHDADDEQF